MNYCALFASKSDHLSLVVESNAKTNNRYTSEHSLIGSMSLLILVALTHFRVVDVEMVEWRQQLEKLSEEEKILYYLVSDFFGNKPVQCIPGKSYQSG